MIKKGHTLFAIKNNLPDDTGSALMFCSEDCVIEYAKYMKHRPNQDFFKLEIRKTKIGNDNFICMFCADCGFNMLVNNKCLLHADCPDYDWSKKINFMLEFYSMLDEEDLSDEQWSYANTLMITNPFLTPDELIDLIGI